MRRGMGVAMLAAAAATAAVCITVAPGPAAATTTAATARGGDGLARPVEYRPPVDAPVVDGFRPPSTPFGAGNVGIDYATTPGTPVVAAAAGQVVFAGRVGFGLHVVVLHEDGIRTSSSFLASIAVRRGQEVAAGEVVGTTGAFLHFGARAGDAYLDPLVLFGAGVAVSAHLVPDGQRAMGSEADERGGLRRSLGAVPRVVVGVGATAVGWARDGVVVVGTDALASAEQMQGWFEAVVPLGPSSVLRVASGIGAWWDRRDECTPAGVEPPPPSARRRVVLVAGLGSTSAPRAGIDGVDTAALGYAAVDVHRFSYRGGTTAESSYTAADTQVDIAESGLRLRELLERLGAAEPGVPIDVIAHSQGGLVARAALGPTPPAGVENLITLATPHQGADLATGLDLVATGPTGAVLEEAVSHLGVAGIDPTSTSVRQLSELSPFLRRLNAQPLPEGVRVTSIAGRADVIVPAPHARLRGATNVVVTVRGLNEHPLVPGAPAATREMALAVAGMAPTCEKFFDAMADVVVGETITAGEDALGLALWGATR